MAKYICIFIGIVMFLFAFFMHSVNSTFIKNGIKTEGTVIDIKIAPPRTNDERKLRSSNGLIYHPIIQFTTEDNKEIKFAPPIPKGPSVYSIGQKIEVMYNPSRPQDATTSHDSLWGFPVIASLIGAFFFFYGLILIRNGH